MLRGIHHRDTEFTEFGEFLNQKLFTPRPPPLSGAISEPCFTGKSVEPFFLLCADAIISNRRGSTRYRAGQLCCKKRPKFVALRHNINALMALKIPSRPQPNCNDDQATATRIAAPASIAHMR